MFDLFPPDPTRLIFCSTGERQVRCLCLRFLCRSSDPMTTSQDLVQTHTPAQGRPPTEESSWGSLSNKSSNMDVSTRNLVVWREQKRLEAVLLCFVSDTRDMMGNW